MSDPERQHPFYRSDLMSLDLHIDDPEPFYEWLREEEPLFWDENNEIWAVSRYEDVVFCSRNTELFSSSQGVIPTLSLEIWPDAAMINLDGTDHTRQRNLVAKGFTPRRIAKLEARVQILVDALINRFCEAGSCDLVTDFARPLPMRIIGEMLGYPAQKDGEILDWTDAFVRGGCGPEYIDDVIVEAFGMFCEYHEEILENRKEAAGDDLISVWLNAEIDGERLDEETLLYEHSLLLVGGSETTRNTISGGLEALLQHPDQLAALKADPSLIPNAAEEMLRWTCPFIRMARTLTQDYEMHGKTMKAGQEVALLYPAANRDHRVFKDPHAFDIHRSFDKPGLSFGYGKHYCLGAPLARMEIVLSIEAILGRLPDLRLKEDGVCSRRRSSFIRGLETLPVQFRPSPRVDLPSDEDESAAAVGCPFHGQGASV